MEDNLPDEVRAGLDDVLAHAMNVLARATKRERMAFWTSEDALTWTILRGLQAEGALAAVPPADEATDGEPSLVLWGAGAGGPAAERVVAELVAVSDALGEAPRRRSEPDVVIHWDSLLVVVEAKYLSGNDQKSPDYAHWARYLERDDLWKVPAEQVRALRRYELARNWRIAVELAERLGVDRVVLVNLGQAKLATSAEEFGCLLAQDESRAFVSRTWASVLADVAPLPLWLDDYAREHKLISASGPAEATG